MHLLENDFLLGCMSYFKDFSDIIHTIIEKKQQYNSKDVLTNMYLLLHVEVYFSTNQF